MKWELDVARHRRIFSSGLVFVAYMLLSLAFYGHQHSFMHRIFGSGTDPYSFVWALGWWPWAITHGANPFFTKYLWYPTGTNLTWATSVPALALLGWPITAIFSAVATFNIFSLAAPALGAWACYLLCFKLSSDRFASVIGGFLYGFSGYEAGHLLGHLNLDVTFLPPLVILWSIERILGERSPRSYVPLLSVALIIQLGLSTEVFATLCVFGALTWLVFLPFMPENLRRRMLRLPFDIVAAGVIAIIVCFPYLFYIIKGLKTLPSIINSPEAYSADLLNFIIPTETMRFGWSLFSSISLRFPGNTAEQGAYLGLPLVGILFAFFGNGWHTRFVLPLLIILIALLTFSLGPSLWINGIQTHVTLPWYYVDHLPFLRSALPGRFTMYVSLATAIIATLWISAWHLTEQRITRLVFGLLACVFLLPNSHAYSWNLLPVTDFFNPKTISKQLPSADNVIILPFGFSGPSMLWQAQSRFYFTQTGGYFGTTPLSELSWPAVNQLLWSAPSPTFANDLLGLCISHNVHQVIMGPGTTPVLAAAMQKLDWATKIEDGVTIFEVPPSSNQGYYRIQGDYWGGSGWVWMGKGISLETTGYPMSIAVQGHSIDHTPSVVTVSTGVATKTYALEDGEIHTLQLPATGVTTITAAQTFVPDQISHDGDTRALSVRIKIILPGDVNIVKWK